MRSRRGLLGAAGLSLAVLAGAVAQVGVDRAGAAPAAVAVAAPRGDEDDVRIVRALDVEVPDEELLDQDGVPVRIRDLFAGRAVAVNFVFTTCTTICSPMTAIFARLQRELGAAMDDRVRLVSISLDPTMDTPERLKRYADRFDRRPGWTFLTGSPDRVVRVLKALGGYAAAKERHEPLTLIGSAAEGRWTRVYGIASTRRLAEQVHALLDGAPAPQKRSPLE